MNTEEVVNIIAAHPSVSGIDNVIAVGQPLTMNRIIDLAGNVLEISGVGGPFGINGQGIYIDSSNAQTKIGDINDHHNGTNLIINDDSASYFTNNTNNILFGINTSTPSVALDVVGDTHIAASTSNTGFTVTNNGDTYFTVNTNDGNISTPTLSGTGTRAVVADVDGVLSTIALYTKPYAAKTSTYSILTTDYIIDCTTGTFTATLPTAVGVTGREYIIKNSGSGVITLATTSAQTLDGALTQTLATKVSLKVLSNGVNWIIL